MIDMRDNAKIPDIGLVLWHTHLPFTVLIIDETRTLSNLFCAAADADRAARGDELQGGMNGLFAVFAQV